MDHKLRVALEVGPKMKRVVAVAPNWPGLERGAKSEGAALELLASYVPRYARVATLARMGREFTSMKGLEIKERYEGTGSTDFWGISFAFSKNDARTMSSEELQRELRLMRACWTFFDETRERVSAELKKGPRGGGRDRDRIALHTIRAEQEWARKVGVQIPEGFSVTEGDELRAYRDEYCKAIRAFHAKGKNARTWPLRFLIRHTAFHTMDHAWEMEDKDLSADERPH
jgi:hypothetical protein